EIRMYEKLFTTENMSTITDDFKNHLNPDSLKLIPNAALELSLKEAKVGDQMQFERIGYFRVDEDSTQDHLIFNRTITLRDSRGRN
ncbi:MAG: glutamine--tRNA ligase, partial [Ekhidna sp.]|nr:glutamine--tRNA ligase [Ekhidna sp.]